MVDENNNPVPNFTVVLADAESTNTGEAWSWQTNAGVWQQLTTLGSDSPTLTGLGTQTANIVGNQSVSPSAQAAYLLSTQAPSQLVLTSTNSASGQQAIAIGFATTRIRLQKYVAWRVQDADQFQLDIVGTPSGQAITAGDANGLQPQMAQVYAAPGIPYSIQENMAAGSISQLYQYTSVVSAMNATLGGSFPPTGSLPVDFTPALGDDVTYTIYNQISYMYHKTVDKTYAEMGEILTYTVFIPNPNPYPITDVQFTDPTPPGTTYIGDLWVDKAYTGTDPNSGLVITSIPANGSVTILWKVKIDTEAPIASPLVNVGFVEIPSGNSGVTSFATTDICISHVTIQKTVNKAFAKPGEWLTYTLILRNEGNVAANNVAITDEIPRSVTLVPGSLTGAVGTFPNLRLNAPLKAGGTAIVSYQVKISDTVPTQNPIFNSAEVIYQYTVDPAHPNAKTGIIISNAVSTLVQAARLSLTKRADRLISYVGDTITYQLAVVNTGNVPAGNVIITHKLTDGTSYVPTSLSVSVPHAGDLTMGIALTEPITPGKTVTITFQVFVAAIPNPSPIESKIVAVYNDLADIYTLDRASENAESNTVVIPVFRYHFEQQLSDLIHSVALEQAALAAIVNSEGAKIQRMVAMNGITPQELLCLNKNAVDLLDSIAMLETVLKQKLSIFGCRFPGNGC